MHAEVYSLGPHVGLSYLMKSASILKHIFSYKGEFIFSCNEKGLVWISGTAGSRCSNDDISILPFLVSSVVASFSGKDYLSYSFQQMSQA